VAQVQSENGQWRYIWWVMVLLLLALFWASMTQGPQSKSLSYTEFKQDLVAGKVVSVTFHGQQISGVLRTKPGAEAKKGTANSGGKAGKEPFSTTMPPIDDPDLLAQLRKHDVTVRAEATSTPWWERMLVGLLPWLLLIGLFYYAARRMQRAGGGQMDGMFGFGKSKARRFRRESVNITFDDVAGLEGAKQDLHEIIDYLKQPARFQALGAKIPKGILMMGPPGTGKTLLAKAVAGEADVPFYSISGSEFVEMFVGVGAARVRDMFKSAKEEAPAIIFIDEIDSVGRARGSGLGGGHDEREQTLNQILSEMDGFAPHHTVVVIAATNRPDVLDAALLRPGRFDRKVTLELPRRAARRHILEIHSREVPLADDVDLDVVAARTVGFSGADLENLVNEAALLAARGESHAVDLATFDKARDKIVLGAERERLSDEEDKRVVAYHESGHALMARLLPQADPLEKVTIIPRGRALGATEQMPEEDRLNLKQGYLLDRIGVMLGGRVSERVVFDEASSGAEQDLRQATHLARRMICQWGMSDRLGPVFFQRGEEHLFLGRELSESRDFSDYTARLIDEEIEKLLREVEERVQALMARYRAQLDTLAAALMEHEVLEATEIERLLAGVPEGGAS